MNNDIFSSFKKLSPLSANKLTAITLLILVNLLGCKLPEPSPYDCNTMPEQYKNLPETVEYLFILWRPQNETMTSFKTALFDNIVPQLEAYNPDELKVLVREPNIKSLTLRSRPLVDGSNVSAVISFAASTNEEAIAVAQLMQAEASVSFVAAYKALRAVPRDYTRYWADGVVSPGIQQMTFLQRKVGMADQPFKDYWFCSHTPFALDTHPISRYERNRVTEALTENAPNYDGIVGLHMENTADLTDLNRFLAGKIVYWGLRVQVDVLNFLNMNTIEVSAMSEHILKSDFVAPSL